MRKEKRNLASGKSTRTKKKERNLRANARAKKSNLKHEPRLHPAAPRERENVPKSSEEERDRLFLNPQLLCAFPLSKNSSFCCAGKIYINQIGFRKKREIGLWACFLFLSSN